MNQQERVSLRIGELAVVRPGTFRAKISVVYAGMLSDTRYSIAVLWTSGNNSLCYNLFLPVEQREIPLLKGKLVRCNVTRDRFHFVFEE